MGVPAALSSVFARDRNRLRQDGAGRAGTAKRGSGGDKGPVGGDFADGDRAVLADPAGPH